MLPVLAGILWLATLVAPARGEGDGPAWKNYAAARTDARENGHLVLVDVYTDWCGWCKKMDRDVYSDSRVRAYLAAHFEVAKLDAESATTHEVDGRRQTERQIAAAFGARSYPTTLFLTADGTLITAVPGYVKADTFLDVLEYIAGGHYASRSWNAFLESKGKK